MHTPNCSPYCAKQHCTRPNCTNDAVHGTKRCHLHSATTEVKK